MQAFYGILVQHFANLAGASPPPMDQLDVLTTHLLELTSEVPLYAATSALARLKRLQDWVSEALQIGGEIPFLYPSYFQPSFFVFGIVSFLVLSPIF